VKRCAWFFVMGCVASSSCVLSDFHKVEANIAQPVTAGSVSTKPASDAGLPGASDECNACIAAQCAQPLAECGADCAGVSLPITPATPGPDSVVPFLACLKQQCDDTCNVTWGCVKHYKWPEPAAPFTIDLQVSDLASSAQRLTGASVSACIGSDPGCTPGSGLAAHAVSDSLGHALLTVPRSFVGYFLVKADSDDYMPAIGLWSQPAYWVAHARTQPMVLWTVADVLGAGTDTTVDRTQSHLVFQVLNCLPLRLSGNSMANAQADDVKVSYTPPGKNSSQVFYTITGAVIDRTRDSTSSSGGAFGGVFNLPPQLITVVGQHDGMEVSRASLQMRAGTVGFLFLLPNAMQ
jgi:hypothetical protein